MEGFKLARRTRPARPRLERGSKFIALLAPNGSISHGKMPTDTPLLSPVGVNKRSLNQRQIPLKTLLCVGAFVLILLMWIVVPRLVTMAPVRPAGPLVPLPAPFTVRVELGREMILRFAGCLFAASLFSLLRQLKDPVFRPWKKVEVAALLSGASVFLFGFVQYFGRRQFAAYDYQIVIDTAWRQYLGQRAYVDFLSSAPPGFDLGLKYAFLFFGPTWNAVLLLTAIFTVVTFLWSYWLLRKAGGGVWVAFLTALAVQSSAMLTLCFWWYNNTAIVMATLFLLSCVLFLRGSVDWRGQTSLLTSAVLLLLMKPNFAGLAVLGGALTVLLFGHARRRFLLLMAGSCGFAFVLLLAHRISLVNLAAAYQGASKERGVWSTFGLQAMLVRRGDAVVAYCSLAALCVPLALFLIWTVRKGWPGQGWKSLGAVGITLTSVVVAVYGLRTNGEIPNLEWAVLLAALGVFVAGNLQVPSWLRTMAAVLLFTFTVSDMYVGVTRLRMHYTGVFFNADKSDNRVTSGLLGGMYVSDDLRAEQEDAAKVMRELDGPYFFGPRIDFSYAEYGLVSPPHLPVWYHRGTAFDQTLMPVILERWRKENFRTLIFYKNDHSYYTPEFMALIGSRYTVERRTRSLTVYRARPELLLQDFTSPDGGGLPVRR